MKEKKFTKQIPIDCHNQIIHWECEFIGTVVSHFGRKSVFHNGWELLIEL